MFDRECVSEGFEGVNNQFQERLKKIYMETLRVFERSSKSCSINNESINPYTYWLQSYYTGFEKAVK